MAYTLVPLPAQPIKFAVLRDNVLTADLIFDVEAGEWCLTLDLSDLDGEMPAPFTRAGESFETLGEACAFLGVPEPRIAALYSPEAIGRLLQRATGPGVFYTGERITLERQAALGRLAMSVLRPDLLAAPIRQQRA